MSRPGSQGAKYKWMCHGLIGNIGVMVYWNTGGMVYWNIEDTLYPGTVIKNESDIQFGPTADIDVDLNDTQPLIKEIKLHRRDAFQDFMDFYSQPGNRNLKTTTFEVNMLNQNGEIKMAEDNGGVMRDMPHRILRLFLSAMHKWEHSKHSSITT